MATGNGVPRTYTISTETATGNVNLNRLTREIEDDVAITTILDYINADDDADQLDIYFVAPLGAGEITALDSLVAAHTGAPLFKEFQIWESNPDQSTTLQTWQTAFSRTSQALQKGAYILTWYAEIRVDPTGPLNSRAAVRFRIDANIKGNSVNDYNQFVPFTGWDRYTARDGDEPVLDVQYRRDNVIGGNDTIVIRKLKLAIQRIIQ